MTCVRVLSQVMANAHGKPQWYIHTLMGKVDACVMAWQHRQRARAQMKTHEFTCASRDDTEAWVAAVTGAIAKANHLGPVVRCVCCVVMRVIRLARCARVCAGAIRVAGGQWRGDRRRRRRRW
jgi:hypothetical protein